MINPKKDAIFIIQLNGFIVLSNSHEAAMMPPRIKMYGIKSANIFRFVRSIFLAL
jgi:hypothetical protein